MRDTVIFDFGGVITSSPFAAFDRLERARGLPQGLVRRINATDPDGNAWARLERAEIDVAGFDTAFAAEARALGHDLRGHDVLALLEGDIRPRMVAALRWLKHAGYVLGCLTNTVPGVARRDDVAAVLALFDRVIESSAAGVRKPDPRIYAMMCAALERAPSACVYLDDLGINCKPAAAMGMAAIKVTGDAQALDELGAVLGIAPGSF
jgi:putative hydrolase of the HAD superfamily